MSSVAGSGLGRRPAKLVVDCVTVDAGLVDLPPLKGTFGVVAHGGVCGTNLSKVV